MDLSTRIVRALARVARREFARDCTPLLLKQLLETGLQDSREVVELVALRSLDELPGALAAVGPLLDPAVLPEVLEWVRSLDNADGWRDAALRALLPGLPGEPAPAGRGLDSPRPERAWEAASPEERLELQRRALWELCELVEAIGQEPGLEGETEEAFRACGRLGAVLDPSLRDEAIRLLFQRVSAGYYSVNAAAALCESFPPQPKAAAMRAVWRELRSLPGYPLRESELMDWLRHLTPRPRAVPGPPVPKGRAMELARRAMSEPRSQRVVTVVSMLEAARDCSAHELVLEELVYPLGDPAVYGAPEVHAALGDYFDAVSRNPELELAEHLRVFQPVLLRMGGAQGSSSGWPPETPKGEPVVVRTDELEPNARLELCYRGVPFTGIALDFHPNGVKSSEASYVDGFQSGVARDYSEQGRVVYEAHYQDDGPQGVVREWYPDGTLKSEAVYEFGREVSRREWDAQGRLLVPREPKKVSDDS